MFRIMDCGSKLSYPHEKMVKSWKLLPTLKPYLIFSRQFWKDFPFSKYQKSFGGKKINLAKKVGPYLMRFSLCYTIFCIWLAKFTCWLTTSLVSDEQKILEKGKLVEGLQDFFTVCKLTDTFSR